MAKTNMQMPMPTGGKIWPKLVATIVGVVLLVIVVKHPAEAADMFGKAIAGFGMVIDGLWSFVQQLG